MTVEEVESTGLRGKVRAQRTNGRSECVEVPKEMLVVIALAGRSLYLERQVSKREMTLVEVERKLQVASSAAMLAQESTLEGAEEALKCREKLEAQVFAIKVRDDVKAGKRQVANFEADYVVNVGRGRDEVGELTKQLRQQAAFTAVRQKELATVHAEIEKRKAMKDSLDETLKTRRI